MYVKKYCKLDVKHWRYNIYKALTNTATFQDEVVLENKVLCFTNKLKLQIPYTVFPLLSCLFHESYIMQTSIYVMSELD